MAVFVELVTDVFQDNFARQKGKAGAGDSSRSARAGKPSVRRPLRGIEIKEDTYALIKVIRADGREIQLVDSSAVGEESGYANFLLQQVQEQRMEKHQIVETFGDSYVFLFGESPRFLTVTAQLLNSHDFNWRAEWWENYDRYLRGSKLAELGARLYLFYDDNVVEGYLLECAANEDAMNPHLVQVQFRIFVTNYANVSMVGSPRFPIREGVTTPDGIEVAGYHAAELLINKMRGDAREGAVDKYLTTLANRKSTDAKTMSDALRATARSYAFSPDVFRLLDSADPETKKKLVYREGRPLRGNIAENVDEYTGGEKDGYAPINFSGDGAAPPAISPLVRSQQEANDLFYEAIQFLSCYGADINSPDALDKLGLTAKLRVTERGLRPSLTFHDGSGSGRDPLDFIYGVGAAEHTMGRNRAKYVEGAGDPLYGYPSDFASGPGFGQAGFGDMGGFGFGSALGQKGDPGFKDPDKFTFAGVVDERSAFDRFMQPKRDTTSLSFGAGVSLGTGGFSGGAGMVVDGEPTGFAFIVVPGELDEQGMARRRAKAIAEKQAEQKFGFSTDNPFGVNCPSPGGLSFSFSLP